MNIRTDRDLGTLLGKSAEYVRNQCKAQRWPHLRVGRSYRFTDEHVAAIVELLEVPARPEVFVAQSWGRKRRGVTS